MANSGPLSYQCTSSPSLEDCIIKNEKLIIDILHPGQVLVLLTDFIKPEQRQAVQKKEKNSGSIQASDALLGYLKENNVSGWGTAFLNALRIKGFEYLAMVIEGYKTMNDPVLFTTLIQVLTPDLMDSLDLQTLLPYCCSYGLISKADQEEISAALKNTGISDGILLFLERIPTKLDTWFPEFLWILLETARKAKVIEQELSETQHGKILSGIGPKFLICSNRKEMIEMCKYFANQQRGDADACPSAYTQMSDLVNADSGSISGLGENMDLSDPLEKQQSDVNPPSTWYRLPPIGAKDSQLQPATPLLPQPLTLVIPSHPVQPVQPMRPPPEPMQTADSDDETDPKKLLRDRDFVNTNLNISVDDDTHAKQLLKFEQNALGGKYGFGGFGESSDSESDNESVEPDNSAQAPRLELRSYQTELARAALQGKNVVIVAPTGSGKTHVAMKISKNHLTTWENVHEKKAHILFIVPTTALVEQQRQQYAKYLPQYKIRGLSGEEKGAQKMSLSLLYQTCDVLVMTPQILFDALQEKDVGSLREFSLLIFDECHHAMKGHPYNNIMSLYVDELLHDLDCDVEPALPQVVGLTASVGVGKAGKQQQAVDHILGLCANLAAEQIITVVENVDELRRFQNLPREDTFEVKSRVNDPFTIDMQQLMSKIQDKMKKTVMTADKLSPEEKESLDKLLNPPADQASELYTQWISTLERHVAKIWDQYIRRSLYACSQHLKMYHIALLLNADCRTKDAVEYLKRQKKDIEPDKKDDMDEYLDQLFDGQLKKLGENKQVKNPKLEQLKKTIMKFYSEITDMRGIVFCKTREMTMALQNWMKEDEDMKVLQPERLVGSNAKNDRGGATKAQQGNVLTYFKDGRHKIIIATTVAEEGLDIQKCNVVIRYEHVTNETARIQAKGRARAEGPWYVLIAHPNRVEKESLNKMREELMDRAMREIIDMAPQEFRTKVLDLQREARVQRKMKEIGKKYQSQNTAAKKSANHAFELRCIKCDNFGCFSDELRQIKTSHHVVVDPEFSFRITTKPYPDSKTIDQLQTIATVFCKKCENDLGMRALYHNVPVHVLRIASFVIVESTSGKRDKFKKWKKVPFTVSQLTSAELEQMSNVREDLMSQ